jgi:hypothetical protein
MLDRRSLLDFDPDLGEGLDPARFATAERHLVCRLERVGVGDWRPGPEVYGARGGIGLILVEGFMVRLVALEHRTAGEVLGPGDLLRPWQDDGEHAVYPFEAAWRAIQPMTFGVIDKVLTARLGPFPEVTSALAGRAMARSRRIAGHLVLAQLASVEHRVLLALWHMADLWGRVRTDGIVVPIRLTHELLGSIVGARRPSVTAALSALDEQGLAHAQPGGGFLLTGEPPSDLPLVRGAAPGRRRRVLD